MTAQLLLFGALRHYGWPLVPVAIQGQVWNLCGALAILFLLALAVRPEWSRLTWLVAIWFAGEELLVAWCSAAWLIAPWESLPGDELCTGRVGFKLGAIGLVVLAVLAYKVIPSTFSRDRQL